MNHRQIANALELSGRPGYARVYRMIENGRSRLEKVVGYLHLRRIGQEMDSESIHNAIRFMERVEAGHQYYEMHRTTLAVLQARKEWLQEDAEAHECPDCYNDIRAGRHQVRVAVDYYTCYPEE